jgi:ABC-type nitrate/sulfonate/bicarbonate transport system substrate-binding protein
VAKRIVLCLTLTALAIMAGSAPVAAQTPAQFTEWGWPQPYEKVSQKSVDFLKGKGWWPIRWGYQSPWFGQANVPLLVREKGLGQKRGLDVELRAFLAGPPLNEALIAGELQIGIGGNFPLTTLIARNAPVHSPGIVWTPNLEHSILVPLDSPAKSVADLKGKTVGLVTGSSAEFAFVAYARGNGLDPKAVTVRTLPIPDQATMPRGIDAVLPWSPTPLLMSKYRKNARLLTDTADHQIYWGTLHVRDEIFDNAPDVVQAIVDMCVEALLIARLNPKDGAAVLRTDPALAAYPDELLYDETVTNMVNYKPSWIYPFVDVYAFEGARVAKFLHEGGRLRAPLTDKDYRDWFRGGTTWLDNTFRKLGWKIPKEPPYFVGGMTTERFKQVVQADRKIEGMLVPYKMDKPQEFPEPGDLEKPWYFGGKWYRPGQ